MSHITPMKTSFLRLDCLAAACAKLGLVLEQGQGLTVMDYAKKSVAVEARLRLGGKYDVGFRRVSADAPFEMVADYWGVERDCPNEKVKNAVRAAGGAERGLLNLLEHPYNVAVAEATIAEQYSDCDVEYQHDTHGEVINITLTRRRY